MPVRFKICCLQDADELALAVRAGAHVVGFVGRGLSGPEVIDDDAHIADLVRRVPPGVQAWLLTRESDPAELVRRVTATGVGAVQLCDAVPSATRAALRRALPNVRVIQVIHVSGPGSVDEAVAVAPEVDALVLDSGTPAGAEPVFGGSGRTHDWTVSAEIVRRAGVPVWLAGGLRAENVGEAFVAVRPFGVDVCTGVRRDGRLDPTRLLTYASVARALG